MSDQNLQEILEETQVEEVAEEATQEAQVAQKEAQRENDAAKNFRQLREKAERLERERDEAIRHARDLESRKDHVKITQEEDDFHMEADSIVEGKHLSKMHKKLKQMEQKFEQYQKQSAETIVETRLKAQHPDFDNVVTRDNIELLRTNYPELANLINSSTDLFAQGQSAYTLIKKLGIQPDETYRADVEKAQKNAAKPKSLASIGAQQGDSPMSRANAFANGLTSELKAQLLKEMDEVRRNS